MKKLALLTILAFVLPLMAHAALININTADAAALDTLPGIGSTKAGAIVAYRTAHGSFAKIADIQNVSGIGPSTYADIAALITVEGGVSTVSDTGTDTSDTATATTISSTVPTDEAPVLVSVSGDRTVVAGAEVGYVATVSDKSDTPYSSAEVRWSWGDGSSGIGMRVNKSYQLPGTYAVGVSAVAGGGSGTASFTVAVVEARVAVTAVTASGITITNEDTQHPLDLSYWQLSAGAGLFTMPQGTTILPGAAVTFTPEITGLVGATSAILLYPSGKPVVQVGTPMQPVAMQSSSYQVQSVHVTQTVHANTAVGAPATSTIIAAAGAALPPEPEVSGGGILRTLTSPWTLGFLGLLVFSAGAFILL